MAINQVTSGTDATSANDAALHLHKFDRQSLPPSSETLKAADLSAKAEEARKHANSMGGIALQALEQEARARAKAAEQIQAKANASADTQEKTSEPYRAVAKVADYGTQIRDALGFGHSSPVRVQSDVFYGAGNKDISTDEIRNGIQAILAKHPDNLELAAKEIVAGAMTYELNAKQLADAKIFTQEEIDGFLASKGISPEHTTKQLSANLDQAQAQFDTAKSNAESLYDKAYSLALDTRDARAKVKQLEDAFYASYIGKEGGLVLTKPQELIDAEAELKDIRQDFYSAVEAYKDAAAQASKAEYDVMLADAALHDMTNMPFPPFPDESGVVNVVKLYEVAG